jgi:predicted Zn-dependent protease
VSDYLEAARCVMEDMQPAAAIELLTRGKNRFPAEASFAFDAAWLLLSNGRPEDAGVMLEHGFAIPFPEEQKQTALAMLVCAAEQTSRAERADEAFAELLTLSAEWGSEEALKGIDWPEELKQSLLAVAARNR